MSCHAARQVGSKVARLRREHGVVCSPFQSLYGFSNLAQEVSDLEVIFPKGKGKAVSSSRTGSDLEGRGTVFSKLTSHSRLCECLKLYQSFITA